MNWPQIIYSEEAMREVFGIENVNIPLEDKVRLIEAISETGIQRISVGAFVSPKFVPQMASFEKLLTRFNPKEGVSYLTFLHNQKAKKMAEQFSPPLTIEEERCTLFIDICDIHQRRNVNRSIQQIMDSWPDHIQEAKDRGVKTASVAIASAWGSNFMGAFTQDYRLSMLSHEIQLIESMGLKVHDIGLHDSQSFCLPHLMEADITEIKRRWPHIKHFHLHMHNARGMAMSSIYVAFSPAMQEWGSDVGVSKHLYKGGFTDEDPKDAVKALNDDAYAGQKDSARSRPTSLSSARWKAAIPKCPS